MWDPGLDLGPGEENRYNSPVLRTIVDATEHGL